MFEIPEAIAENTEGGHASLAAFRNGGFEVEVFADGTKVRRTLDASVAPIHPEHFDLKITGWCDAGCAWCHEGSTTKGEHGDLRATVDLLRGMQSGTEVAIGGGDPLSHPDFAWFVREVRGFGLIPSVTVNGRHLERSLTLLKELTGEGSLFGVGVSFHKELPQWDYPHLVHHMIAGVDSPAVLDGIDRPLKILLLGYKRFGRGEKLFEVRPEPVQRLIAQWHRELPAIAAKHHLSFDNLAIEQLAPRRLFRDQARYDARFMGEEGAFGMYIDAVTQTFALSSYSVERRPWSTMADMFGLVRTAKKCESQSSATPATSAAPAKKVKP